MSSSLLPGHKLHVLPQRLLSSHLHTLQAQPCGSAHQRPLDVSLRVVNTHVQSTNSTAQHFPSQALPQHQQRPAHSQTGTSTPQPQPHLVTPLPLAAQVFLLEQLKTKLSLAHTSQEKVYALSLLHRFLSVCDDSHVVELIAFTISNTRCISLARRKRGQERSMTDVAGEPQDICVSMPVLRHTASCDRSILQVQVFSMLEVLWIYGLARAFILLS